MEGVDDDTLNNFVDRYTDSDAEVYTDGSTAYKDWKNHEAVSRSAGEYVRYLRGTTIHSNGVKSFWSMLKRAHKGVYHKLSAEDLQPYVSQFAGPQNVREMDTLEWPVWSGGGSPTGTS